MPQNNGWVLFDVEGSTAINFTSFLGVSIESNSEAPTNPIEEGSFASYNKVEKPLTIRVSLGGHKARQKSLAKY